MKEIKFSTLATKFWICLIFTNRWSQGNYFVKIMIKFSYKYEENWEYPDRSLATPTNKTPNVKFYKMMSLKQKLGKYNIFDLLE